MRAISAPKTIFQLSTELKNQGQTVGLVPTMGALHDGHVSLIERSLGENSVTIVSIFINPLQFNNASDLEAYPKTVEKDKQLLKSLGVDFLFIPQVEEIYPSEPLVSINFGEMETVLEGQFRPGHFKGVGVVVSILFNLVAPTRAYFGMKDLQQFLLIKRMAKELNFPIEVVGVETKRGKSGLAMSSRNKHLSQEGLQIGAHIYQGLVRAGDSVSSKQPLDELKKEILDYYHSVNGLEVEYLEFVDGSSLKPAVDYSKINELAVCFAGYVEGVRLIDNLYLRLR